MTAKLTIEEVKAKFESMQWKLLDQKYLGNKLPLEVVCPQGHKIKKSWHSFASGHGCPICSGKEKKTIEEVVKSFESEGWKVVDTEYKNTLTPINVICDKGHQTTKSFSNWLSGQRCLICYGRDKKTLPEVKILFGQKGWQVLDQKYINSDIDLDVICPKGHSIKKSWNEFQQGKGCPICARMDKKTVECVRIAFKKKGWDLIDTEYINKENPLKVICFNGHQITKSFKSLRGSKGCEVCGGSQKKTIEFIKSAFQEKGWQLIDQEYINSATALKAICPKGHLTNKTWADLRAGSGCSICSPSGFNPALSGVLYYVRFSFEWYYLYKIGITNRTVEKRFIKESTPYIIIHQEFFPNGQDALEKERKILTKYSKYKYKGEPFLRDGNQELFTIDVLGLDSDIRKG